MRFIVMFVTAVCVLFAFCFLVKRDAGGKKGKMLCYKTHFRPD